MAANKKSDPPATENTPADKRVTIGGNVVDSVVIVGNENTVNKTTIIQKFFNIFKSDSETLEHRNRRILLGHVESAWIKGVLDASLHGAALLDLGIKQDLEAVTKYPWAIKKESTDEPLPTGTSMLEIFDSIGMGRSLLILGAPGSGKTTMLLELARQLIQRAREDFTQPIPIVFNLASWTEKLTLADWLAQELNNLYSVPRKTAPDWVKGNKLLLLLDGLDEVRQESRVQCVEAINEFRKQNGLTSLAVCSRSQDYAALKAKLSFEGAIEVQPLTQKQITEFFNRFGDEMAGIKQALEKDGSLREMAETPLFLSIMLMAYRDKQDVDMLVSGDEKAQRKHLFDTYIERMFERRSENKPFNKLDTLYWLYWLAMKIVEQDHIPYYFENMQPSWLNGRKSVKGGQFPFALMNELFFGLFCGLFSKWFVSPVFSIHINFIWGVIGGLILGLLFLEKNYKISTVDSVFWNWRDAMKTLKASLLVGAVFGLIFGLYGGPFIGLIVGLFVGLVGTLPSVLTGGLNLKQVDQTTYPGQRLVMRARNFFSTFLIFSIPFSLFGMLISAPFFPILGLVLFGLIFGLYYGGYAILQHYTLRIILALNDLLPWSLVPFLDHCVDLIFLRRVGGGYIFVHRLLMEHFAEMYVEDI
ncbi:MAG: NACHT domain-containing protein [Chloroflexi bacterium]|nr:NACHT domain-containing protein [Chloroflexota bacterium]